ncbi:Hsp20/alpha crystallin family protein [Nitrospira sp. NS4]|uniref:Hsp20/alpha crystallin family protein n=1 Tax=Nitrospira sp. NS4 TaxID=3414498 RepID=UPI003C2D644D
MSSYVPTVVSSISPDLFNRQIDRMFDEALRAFGTSGQPWSPACNAWEDGDGFYVEVALPGWETKDLSLEIDNQVLTVKGERREEGAPEGVYHLHEIAGGRFVRLFKLPAFVDQDKASATHKHGLLTVSFPKREEAKCRRIMIEGT